MARNRRRRRPASRPHRYQRTDRVSELVREVVATELEQVDDERLTGVVITAVDVDRELTAAVVLYDVRDAGDGPDVAEALEKNRHRLQRALGSGVRLRRTPTLRFRQDTSVAAAERIQSLLSGLDGTTDDASPDRARPDS
ncbi:MAG TPA: ribosome-binding factor A [Acidimicrobiaceae bacterium]|nr:ribosome-binding factor A [Acidimicrobiaceae bacterium]HCB37639.1 ribosome-binding factor A [Acidimicrobiaceae bacterium]